MLREIHWLGYQYHSFRSQTVIVTNVILLDVPPISEWAKVTGILAESVAGTLLTLGRAGRFSISLTFQSKQIQNFPTEIPI